MEGRDRLQRRDPIGHPGCALIPTTTAFEVRLWTGGDAGLRDTLDRPPSQYPRAFVWLSCLAVTFQREVLAAVRSAAVLVVAVTATLAVTSPASSQAAVDPTFLEELPIVDSFSVPESPLSGDGAWSPLITATFTGDVAGAGMSTGWGPLSHYPTLNGAAWNRGTAPADDGAAAVATTLLVPPDAELQNRYFSLWLDMPSSSSAGTTGYELRFTQIEVRTPTT